MMAEQCGIWQWGEEPTSQLYMKLSFGTPYTMNETYIM